MGPLMLVGVPGAVIVAAAGLWVLVRHRIGHGDPDLGTISGRWIAELARRSDSPAPARR